MKLLIFVLNKEELLDDVMAAFIEADVPGATIIDSEGMGHFLTYEVPLFADFKDFMKGNKPYNKTIISVIKNEETIPVVVKLLNQVCGDLSKPGTGILFTIPVDFCQGLFEEEN